MSADVVTFPLAKARKPGQPNGVVEVWMLSPGLWGVSHFPRAGNACVYIGCFPHADAVARGRHWADELGATFFDRAKGDVTLQPEEGGRWSVHHVSRSGDSGSCLGDFKNHAEAAERGRQWAAEMGADFSDEGEAGGAA